MSYYELPRIAGEIAPDGYSRRMAYKERNASDAPTVKAWKLFAGNGPSTISNAEVEAGWTEYSLVDPDLLAHIAQVLDNDIYP